MGLINRVFGRSEARATLPEQAEERAEVVLSDSWGGALAGIVGMGGSVSETVGFREAMTLPPVFAAVNFLAAALASLPVRVYERKPEGQADMPVDHPVAHLFNRAASDDWPAYEARRVVGDEWFGPGRGLLYVERDTKGEVINLFPMEQGRCAVRRTGRGAIFYDYTRIDGTREAYAAADVIDLAFKRHADFITSDNPVLSCAGAIRQGLNAQRYSLTVFGRNGVPPYTLQGPFSTGAEAKRASADVEKVAARAAAEGKPILPMPMGMELKRLGDDPEKMQLTEVQRFVVEQCARVWQLPPVFLQDLSKGTYSNTEQQDLNLIKNSLRPRVKQFEDAATLRLFGRDSALCLRLDLSAVARADFKTRIEAIARAIQTGQMTPNEGRELDGRGPLEGGNSLFMQSATVPIEQLQHLREMPNDNPPKDDDEENGGGTAGGLDDDES